MPTTYSQMVQKKKKVGMCMCVYRERKCRLAFDKMPIERFQFIVLFLQLFSQVETIAKSKVLKKSKKPGSLLSPACLHPPHSTPAPA